jgi:dipeptidyl aminopeptidase/acylaminoacyl peptidase
VSPDESRLLITHSETNRHPELYVQNNKPGAKATQLTNTMSDEYKAIDWQQPAIVEVPSSHSDEPIYTKIYLPADHDPAKEYPAVMFVHGAGYTQNSDLGWPYYFREGMFHNLLTQHGYVVIDMDFRASAGYGRDWRTAIYRRMGVPELEDLHDGVDYVVENYGVNRERIGTYGGSYGGFMTFVAMFRAPDLFKAGAALRPVSDWSHYNHGYTSNILNTPDIDPEAYRISSPIEDAEGLKNPLLIASGMQDNNVFFQDSVLVVQRLLELKKEDFEIALYPQDPHGFVHPESWLDEYRRIFKLFEANLK